MATTRSQVPPPPPLPPPSAASRDAAEWGTVGKIMLMIIIVLAVPLFYLTMTNSQANKAKAAAPSASSSCAFMDVSLLELPPSSSAEAPPAAPEVVKGSPLPPSSYKTGFDLVRGAVGRWMNEDGLEIAIDPPNPSPAGSKPPYHLIVTKKGGVAYGCDFSDPTKVRVVKKLDGYAMTFRAWCATPSSRLGAGVGTFIALSLDTGYLMFALAVGDQTKVSSGPMVLVQKAN